MTMTKNNNNNHTQIKPFFIMKTKFLLCFLLFIFPVLNGFSQPVSITIDGQIDVDEDLPHPTYASSAAQTDNWGFARYWFLDLRGGVSLQTAEGASVMEQVALGRWLTPAIGGRLAVENIGIDGFNNMYGHVDLMYNTASLFSRGGTRWHRWQWIPFVGIGGSRTGGDDVCFDFAYYYGLDVRCRLSKNMFLTAGLDAVTRHDFANYVDNTSLLPSVGLSFVLGGISNQPRTNGMVYANETDCHFRVIPEEKDSDWNAEPVNDYSGLNSLRARLANPDWDGQGAAPQSSTEDLSADSLQNAVAPCAMTQVKSLPVYFFFGLGSTELLVPNQLINLDDIAAIAVEEGCAVSVAGAADSATGAEETNNALAMKRAEYIKSEIVKRGVPEDRVVVKSEGGISSKQPKEANRYAVVRLQ